MVVKMDGLQREQEELAKKNHSNLFDDLNTRALFFHQSLAPYGGLDMIQDSNAFYLQQQQQGDVLQQQQ